VTLNWSVEPRSRDKVPDSELIVMDVIFTGGGVTVTVQEATLLLPSLVVAETTVVPSVTAVTRPVSLTAAKPGVVEVQDRALFSASCGSTVAESCLVSPTARLIAVSLRVTDSTSLGPEMDTDPPSEQEEKSAIIKTHQRDAGRNRDFLI
jgi:hypothetical protein